jgi:hypothetical protein
MKKYIIGAVVGALAVLGGYAAADSVSTFTVIDHINVGYGVNKIYDKNSNVICYTMQSTYGTAISCLKDN